MLRSIVLPLALALPCAALATPRAAFDDPGYDRANARLAKATPHYPRARLLIDEPVGGEVGSTPFSAVERIYFLSRPTTQRAVTSFYLRRLGRRWKARGDACLVSGSRLVVALLDTRQRRLGVAIDSRGAMRCHGMVGVMGDLLGAGYPTA